MLNRASTIVAGYANHGTWFWRLHHTHAINKCTQGRSLSLLQQSSYYKYPHPFIVYCKNIALNKFPYLWPHKNGRRRVYISPCLPPTAKDVAAKI